jgi:hypothetical protein
VAVGTFLRYKKFRYTPIEFPCYARNMLVVFELEVLASGTAPQE